MAVRTLSMQIDLAPSVDIEKSGWAILFLGDTVCATGRAGCGFPGCRIGIRFYYYYPSGWKKWVIRSTWLDVWYFGAHCASPVTAIKG